MLPRFYELLREAQNASDEEDNFDLDSKNPESKKKWNELLKAQQEANEKLIMYIRANPGLISHMAQHTKRFTQS